jgi:L-alanine-DL-glutamate epimerase-like enolase superfamily enzyme
MRKTDMGRMTLRTEIEQWPLAAPFRITGHAFQSIDVLVVEIEGDGYVGRGEAAGIYYRGDTPASALKQLESLRTTVEAGLDRHSLQGLLPPGGARNALDCALWDLEAKRSGCPAWGIAELAEPHPLITTFTCSADLPDEVAAKVRTYVGAQAIKLKLTGEPIDADRVRAVRESRPDVWLGIDANQGFSRSFLDRLMPVLIDMQVALIEQPFPIGQDALLDGLRSPIPIAADESVQCRADLSGLVGRFNVVNIKLDKCGGLTEALAMVRAARKLGLDTMVGNMLGTSLAMAPAFLVGQLCKVVDLDGPILLKSDRAVGVQYADGFIMCPEDVWGGTRESIQK